MLLCIYFKILLVRKEGVRLNSSPPFHPSVKKLIPTSRLKCEMIFTLGRNMNPFLSRTPTYSTNIQTQGVVAKAIFFCLLFAYLSKCGAILLTF